MREDGFKKELDKIVNELSDVNISEERKIERDAFRSLTPEEKCAQVVKDINAEKGDLGFPHCVICNDKGYISCMPDNKDWMMPQSRRCSCMVIRQVYKSSEFSEELWDRYSFDKFDHEQDFQKKMFQTAIDYSKNGGNKWLYIDGQTGCGKTHLCVSAIKQIAGKYQSIVFMQWVSDSERLKTMANEIDNGKKKYLTAPLLFIDDFLKTNNQLKPTDADGKLAFSIINYRYNAGLPTIISSEYSLNEIAYMNEAMAGRIKERCGNYVLHIEKKQGRNYRLK